ncbi:MAG: FkbM family methyltransferase [Bacteroidetes bacterium]|nr:FkbM family methyltransferase [Bacteroidota bacterium]
MKKFIINFLNRRGYDIFKTGVPYIKRSKTPSTVKVGQFDILMPGNNPQLVNYTIYPDLNIQLGRLAIAIHKKYPGMTVIDVGANVGDTIAVLKSVADVPVIAIEGDEISYSFLEKNTKQFSGVSLIKTFLSDKPQETTVNFDKDGWNATIIPDEQGSTRVSFRTLDEVVSFSENDKVDIKLLKVDVEGFDTIVLRGAFDTIKKNKPVLFFEYNRTNMKAINEDGLPTVMSFAGYGYNKIVFFDHKGTLVLATEMKNEEVITSLHDYISSSKNLMGYYDIAIFHEQDNDVAASFLSEERKHL